MISGTQWSVNSGQDSSINSNANLVLYAQNNGSIVAGAQQSVMSNENLALGSATGVGIEGCAYVNVTTDGDYDLKTLGNIKILAEGNYDPKSELATRIESANILHAKAVGDLKLRSDATVSNHAGGSLYLYSDGSNIDIQNIIP